MIATIVAGRRAREQALSLEAEGPNSVVRLIEHGLDRAYRLAGLTLGDASEAEDAVGDTIEAAFRHARDLRDPARFEAWFDRILLNRCRDRLRRRTRVRFIPMSGDVVERHDPFGEVLAREEAVRGLRELPADERVVVVLHFWADLTLAEVALRTGWPLGTVKSRLHRALERLRETSTREVGDG